MSRRTTQRAWTEAEKNLAHDIIREVALYRGALVGGANLAHRLRTPLGKVRDVMPLAVMMSTVEHPGKVLAVTPDRGGSLYSITDDPDLISRARRGRARRIDTMVRRFRAEITAEMGAGANPLAAITLTAHAERMVSEAEMLALTLDAIDSEEPAS